MYSPKEYNMIKFAAPVPISRVERIKLNTWAVLFFLYIAHSLQTSNRFYYQERRHPTTGIDGSMKGKRQKYEDYYNDEDFFEEDEDLLEEETEEETEYNAEDEYDEFENDDDFEEEDDEFDEDFSPTKASSFYDKQNPADFIKIMEDYNSGDPVKIEAACEKAVKEMDGMIRSIIRTKYSRYCKQHYEDLLQQGYFGVCKGLATLDPTRGRASTYLYRYIVHEMQEYINTMVNRTTSHYDACVRKIKKVLDKYARENRSYTPLDISIDTNIPMETVEKSLHIIYSGELSMDGKLDPEEGALEDMIPSNEKTPEQFYIEQENLIKLDEAIHRYLDIEEIKVIELLFGIHGCEEMNNKMISKKLNMTSDKIRRCQVSALCKLRQCKELRSLHADMFRDVAFEVDEENAIPLISDVDLDAALDIMKDVEINF